MQRTCRGCNLKKDTIEFYKHPNYKDGLLPKCKQCVRQYDQVLIKKDRIVPSTKQCSQCKQVKSHHEFHIRSRNADGLRSECKTCTRQEEKQYRTNKPDKEYYRKIRQKYGITEEEHHALLAKSDGKCCICKSDEKLVIDHSHKTGAVRGILCKYCNAGLGMFGDNPEFLLSAITYLRTHYDN